MPRRSESERYGSASAYLVPGRWVVSRKGEPRRGPFLSYFRIRAIGRPVFVR